MTLADPQNKRSERSLSQWLEADKKVLWHPFTQMRDWLVEEPLVVDRAAGFYLYDADGNAYIDGHSSLWVNVHGHGHPHLVQAIANQAARLDHSTMLGLSATPAILLAEQLLQRTPPSLQRVFYSDNGSTAVEIALKMSFQYWQQRGEKERRTFIRFAGAYHGDTIGSVSVGGIDLFHEIFHSLLFHTVAAPYPYAYRDEQTPDNLQACTDRALQTLEQLLHEYRGSLCAVVTEPGIQGASGMRLAAPGFLRRVRELCTAAGVHLVVDEVATGFGRTGPLFACTEEGVEPDFLCLAKGITGGLLPLAATLTSEAVFEGFLAPYEEYRAFFHGHSYTGNPIACAAALASLELFDRDRVLETAPQRLREYADMLAPLAAHPHVGEIRRRGWMTGIELVQNRQDRSIWPAAAKIPQKIVEAARRRGAVIRPLGNIMVLMPAPAMDRETLAQLVCITGEAIDEGTAPQN